jgi:hypothetical protein
MEDMNQREESNIYNLGAYSILDLASGKAPESYTIRCFAELDCPFSNVRFWIYDYRNGSPAEFEERELDCPKCKSSHTGLLIRRLSPAGLIEQLQLKSTDSFSMYHEIYKEWVEIAEQNFGHIPSLDIQQSKSFYPVEPGIHETVCITLNLLEELLQKKSLSYGMDWICLALFIEHDLLKLLKLSTKETIKKLKDHCNGKEVLILDDISMDTLCRKVMLKCRSTIYSALERIGRTNRFTSEFVKSELKQLVKKPELFDLPMRKKWHMIPSGDPNTHGCWHIDSHSADLLLSNKSVGRTIQEGNYNSILELDHWLL